MIDKIKEAGKHALLWRKIYNNLCRRCKVNTVCAKTNVKQKGTEGVVKDMGNVVDKYCPRCKKMIKELTE